MAAESIATLRKPGFPKLEVSENSFVTRIEYIGATSTITPAVPDTGDAWGDFAGTVANTNLEPTENPDISELIVMVELKAEASDDPGTLESETYEIEWVVVQRPMYEHPQFAIGLGGANALTSTDIADLEQWQKENDNALKSAYKYARENGSDVELTANAKLFARGIELGQETFEDYAPVARKTSTFVGGPPSTSEAGQKNTPTGFTRLPTGYEWRKSADRSITAGKRTRWEQSEEWLGAKKVLHDRDQIFWAAPS